VDIGQIWTVFADPLSVTPDGALSF